ncbi:MAG: phosphomethylpyrimidine synthase [Nitrospiraceae bacterium]|nr:phosphomethylpyrimidine synthase [Nitrospiraceae bacterium]
MNSKRYGIKNDRRTIQALYVGIGEPTRIVTNIGLIPQVTDVETEFEKAVQAIEAGSDIISDVSIDKDYRDLLSKLISETDAPIATVPLYGTCMNALKYNGSFISFEPNDIIKEIEYQAELGVDIITVHAALTRNILEDVKKSNRLIKIPSRGGAFIAAYMIRTDEENPLYVHFDEILNIAKEYNITISIGPSVRPGSIYDGLDRIYLHEIEVQGRLVECSIKKGVNVMVEGIGHLPMDLIPIAVRLHKEICQGVPLRPLPIATDVSAGHDHIAASIAAAVCAINGADILSVITRGEHVGLPRISDIVEGVKSFKIAAHIADIVKLKKNDKDRKISEGRRMRNWEEIFKHSLYPRDAEKLHEILFQSTISEDECTMCGHLCALKIVDEYMKSR